MRQLDLVGKSLTQLEMIYPQANWMSYPSLLDHAIREFLDYESWTRKVGWNAKVEIIAVAALGGDSYSKSLRNPLGRSVP